MNRNESRTKPPRAPRALLLVAASLAIGGASFLVASDASAGPVRGELRMGERAVPAESGPPAYYWNAWNGFLEPKERKWEPARELTVVLTGASSAPPLGCAYRIAGGDLQPRTIVTKGGAGLRIENRDGCSHELQAEGIEGFAPLATAPGNARAITVPTGGPHEVTDRLYGHIHGWVVGIDDLVACATIEEDGKYAFESVPAGEYTLKVFRDGEEVATQAVTAEDGALSIDPITLE